jgi:outer membrane protein assembly factor BamD
MKKAISAIILLVFLLSGCANEFNKVYKSTDSNYRYEYAKEAFANGKYTKAITLLNELVSYNKGTGNAEESLYMLGMAQYNSKDYESASMTFSKYFSSYRKGKYAEKACFYKGQSLYMSTPEPRLDQTETVAAIHAFQDYLDIFPDANMKDIAQARLFELQDKLVKKELYSARLYYNLGTYFGNCNAGENNYDACIITAQNALKDYPYTSMREEFALLIMKSKYERATMSVEAKKLERFQDAEDECYGFINEYPDSKDVGTAKKYIAACKKITGEVQEEN